MEHAALDRSAAVFVTAAVDPQTEVDELAAAVRRQLEMGIKPSEIGVAFPEPRSMKLF